MAQYQLEQIEAKNDGTGLVKLTIVPLNEEGAIIPGFRSDFLVPGPELSTALADASPAVEVKKLLLKYKPDETWEPEALTERDLINASAMLAVEQLNEFITVDLGKSLPIQFNMGQ